MGGRRFVSCSCGDLLGDWFVDGGAFSDGAPGLTGVVARTATGRCDYGNQHNKGCCGERGMRVSLD